MKMKKYLTSFFPVLILLGVVFLASCGGGGKSSRSQSSEQAKPSVTVSEQAKAEAKQIFVTTCAACHGGEGRGDGPASASLAPPPRDLTDSQWQNSVEDEYIAKIIQYGGGAVGKSIAMPSNPAIGANKEVLTALVMYVRSLKQ